MQKPIFKYGSSLLRQNSLEVFPDEKYLDLIENLFDSLDTKEGIGLAAPQIGILKRMFVIAVPINEDKEDKIQYFKKAYINLQ